MKPLKILLYLSYAFLSFFACSCSSEISDKRIAATIGNEVVSTNTIDRIIEEDIYRHLCEIYDTRFEATHEFVGMILLQKAADENNTTVNDLINSYCVDNGISPNENDLHGLIDSLMEVYNATIMLKEPLAPMINIDSALLHSRGNANSDVVFVELLGYDCGMCRYMYKEYKQLLEQFGNDVKFVHSNFSEAVTPAARAVIAASMQDKYWEMNDTLMSRVNVVDSLTVMNIAAQMNLDMDQFIFDYSSKETINAIEDNNVYLSSQGITQTPTILLNGRKLRKPDDIGYVIDKIKAAINENS